MRGTLALPSVVMPADMGAEECRPRAAAQKRQSNAPRRTAPRESRAARAHGHAQRHLARRATARESREVRDVGAGEEQHECDRGG